MGVKWTAHWCAGIMEIHPCEDTQQHLLSCPKIKNELKSEEMACENIKYEHLFGNTLQQKEAIVLFTNILNARENLKKNMTTPPGTILTQAWAAACALLLQGLLSVPTVLLKGG